jgi:hypothetical protein
MINETVNISELISENSEIIVCSPEWYNRLKNAIDDLIVNDFGRLVQVLYQADVAEEKLKELLRNSGGADASTIIANLLLQRQMQKIKARRAFSSNETYDSKEERW